MHRLLLTIFLLSLTIVKGQQLPNGNCNESNLIPNTYFYPNTSTTYSNSSINQECLYLCGPNTNVYDTVITNPNCRTVFVNSSCVYYTSNVGCPYANYILAKNNSTVIATANANGNSLRIWFEPNATIIIQCQPGGIQTYSCTLITFPTVNCTTSFFENTNSKEFFKVWPNPTSTKINIELNVSDHVISDIRIINQLGEVVFESTSYSVTNKEIPIAHLLNGLYFIQVKTKLGHQIEKFVVNR